MRKETAFQAKVVKKIVDLIPGCFIIKPDSRDIQGLPDLIILYKNTWGALEFKRSKTAGIRPNQSYYINKFGKMSFASFIHPENEGDVLSDLQKAFGVGGKARVSQPK